MGLSYSFRSFVHFITMGSMAVHRQTDTGEIAESSTSIFTDIRKRRPTGPIVGFWNIKAHSHWYTSFNKAIPLNPSQIVQSTGGQAFVLMSLWGTLLSFQSPQWFLSSGKNEMTDKSTHYRSKYTQGRNGFIFLFLTSSASFITDVNLIQTNNALFINCTFCFFSYWACGNVINLHWKGVCVLTAFLEPDFLLMSWAEYHFIQIC